LSLDEKQFGNLGTPVLLMRFNIKDPKNAERLREIQRIYLQKPVDSKADRSVPSHGTGLYLANFAAAINRHRLLLTEVKTDMAAFCLFKLPEE